MAYPYVASVVITAFNRKNILAEVCACLAAQKEKEALPFEVIVVDDGSTDGTGAFVQEVQASQKMPFAIQYYNTGCTDLFGAAIARNAGIRLARGKYLLFLDDDCRPHCDWLRMHIADLESGADVVVGYVSYDRKKLAASLPIAIDEPHMSSLCERLRHAPLQELLSGNCAMQRYCFTHVGLFDERFARKDGYGYEDIEFGKRLLMGGFRMQFNPNAVVYTEQTPPHISVKRREMIKQSKLQWLHIVLHPQQNLPITPLLEDYAADMRKKCEAITEKGENG